MVEISDLVFDVDKLFEGAEPARGFNEVTEAILTEQENELINKDMYRRGVDWSILANQCVGSEKY